MTIVSSFAILIFVMQVFFPWSFLRYSLDLPRSFAVGLGPVPFIIISEVAPSRVRLLFLLSRYTKLSSCGVGCFHSVIGGTLVELYDFFYSSFSDSGLNFT